MTRYLVVVALLAGCLRDDLVACGDKLCPVGSTCLADRCVGADECGNGSLEGDEICDDGNVLSGDGCTADCAKVELCGDAIVDVGEACDDGTANALDGCDGACASHAWEATAIVSGDRDPLELVLVQPIAIAADRDGAVYFGDNYRIRRVKDGLLSTVAGSGSYLFSGDNGPATAAGFEYIRALAVDGLGAIYVATGNRIRKIDPHGIVTTVAGNGVPGYVDAAPPTQGSLAYPTCLAVDGLGMVYVADNSHRVRRFTEGGRLETFAGNGFSGSTGNGGPATGAAMGGLYCVALDRVGNVYITDGLDSYVRRITPDGTIDNYGPPGVQALGIAIDNADRVYVTRYDRIERIDATSATIVAGGTGPGGFGGDGGPPTSAVLSIPQGIAFDASGAMAIADRGNDRIRRVANDRIDTIAGGAMILEYGDGGAATAVGSFTTPSISRGPNGDLYFLSNARIRRIDDTGTVSTFAGDGTAGAVIEGEPALEAAVYPDGVAVDAAGIAYVASSIHHKIYRIENGAVTTFAGTGVQGFSGDNGPATSAKLFDPSNVWVDAGGNVFVADDGSHRIRRIDAATRVITTFAGNGTPTYAGDNGPATSASIAEPFAVAFDDQDVVIVDGGNHRVRRVHAGTITTIAGNGPGFSGDGGPATLALLQSPNGAIVDAQHAIYIADTGNRRIRRIDPAGTITTFAGDGSFLTGIGDGGPALQANVRRPVALALDGASLVIADEEGIRRIRDGTITTIAGDVDPPGVGVLPRARLTDARAIAVGPNDFFVAAGTSGTIEAVRANRVDAVAGRDLALEGDTGALARYRSRRFGAIVGLAYDEVGKRMFVVERGGVDGTFIHAIAMVDPADENTWTIEVLAGTGVEGFADGPAATARFRDPSGLAYDAAANELLVADTGNHAIRSIHLTDHTVHTIAGTPATLGFSGDGGGALDALLFQPGAIARCPSGELMIADTGNQRIRRVALDGTIATIAGNGFAASTGEGAPATSFSIDTPLGIACDAANNVFVTSSTTVRLLPAGAGAVYTIYGRAPRDSFPANTASCLTGLAVRDGIVSVVDRCSGVLARLELR